jgi:hypothetical protein
MEARGQCQAYAGLFSLPPPIFPFSFCELGGTPPLVSPAARSDCRLSVVLRSSTHRLSLVLLIVTMNAELRNLRAEREARPRQQAPPVGADTARIAPMGTARVAQRNLTNVELAVLLIALLLGPTVLKLLTGNVVLCFVVTVGAVVVGRQWNVFGMPSPDTFPMQEVTLELGCAHAEALEFKVAAEHLADKSKASRMASFMLGLTQYRGCGTCGVHGSLVSNSRGAPRVSP